MKIILVGSGKVGTALARQLSEEGHNVTVVDTNKARVEHLIETYDVLGIVGNGSSITTLSEAGIEDADVFIAVTGSDELNLLCCMFAKKAGHCHAIARVRNPSYSHELDFIKKQIGISAIINPEMAAAKEISHLLRFPGASKIDTFADGRVRLIKFALTEAQGLDGVAIREIPSRLKSDILVCAVERDGGVIIPNGNFVPREGDKLYMVGTKSELQKMLRAMGRTQQRVKTVSLLGGSRIAMYLTWELAVSNTKVCIVEQKHDKCLQLAAQLPTAMIIEGDGTEEELLTSENIFQADAFVSLTGRDEENLLMALTARRAGVPKVLAKMTRPNYMDLVRDMRVGSIVSPKDIVANQITRYVRALANSEGSAVESLYKMLGGAVEALEFTATARSRAVLNKPLRALSLKDDVLVAAIARGSEIIIPSGTSIIQEGDHVVVVTNAHTFDDLGDILA